MEFIKKQIKCKTCSKEFETQEAFSRHNKDVHDGSSAGSASHLPLSKKRIYLILAVVIIAAVTILLLVQNINGSKSNKATSLATQGNVAPNSTFTLSNGSVASVSQYRGKTVLLWFVSTWCSSCAQGNGAIDQNINFFKSKNVTLIEVETYRNLGYSGPSISSFVSTYAPLAYANSSIIIGESSYGMMTTYDSGGYPDIYYLIARNGTIVYISGSPAATMGSLKAEINAL